MHTDEIKLLYDYNYWANARLLDAAAGVSPEQYAAPSDARFGHRSLRGTLIHILDGEWQWRITCQGYYRYLLTEAQYDATELTEAQFPTLAALEKRWRTERQEMRSYIGTLNDAQLNGILSYMTPAGVLRERVLWHCLFHALNHGPQHRSEAAALLTGHGASPGDVDFALFLNEHFKLEA